MAKSKQDPLIQIQFLALYRELGSLAAVGDRVGVSRQYVSAVLRGNPEYEAMKRRDIPDCPFCGARSRRNGKNQSGNQQYNCSECRKGFTEATLKRKQSKALKK